jgi:hypothetical protein
MAKKILYFSPPTFPTDPLSLQKNIGSVGKAGGLKWSLSKRRCLVNPYIYKRRAAKSSFIKLATKVKE